MPRSTTVYRAECLACNAAAERSSEGRAEDWADNHNAETEHLVDVYLIEDAA